MSLLTGPVIDRMCKQLRVLGVRAYRVRRPKMRIGNTEIGGDLITFTGIPGIIGVPVDRTRSQKATQDRLRKVHTAMLETTSLPIEVVFTGDRNDPLDSVRLPPLTAAIVFGGLAQAAQHPEWAEAWLDTTNKSVKVAMSETHPRVTAAISATSYENQPEHS